MNTTLKILLTALTLLAMACASTTKEQARYVDSPDVQSASVCKKDGKGNEVCVDRIDTQVKYDQCVVDHAGDIAFCDMKFDRSGFYGNGQPIANNHGHRTGLPQPIVVVAAPPGPNMYANGPVLRSGYAYASAAAARSAVPRAEYERDKRRVNEDLDALFTETMGSPEAETPKAPADSKKK